jgi:hypothetical protein
MLFLKREQLLRLVCDRLLAPIRHPLRDAFLLDRFGRRPLIQT